MAIFAHRGASIEYPENTLAAFRRAIDLGVHGIELDVHLSADEQPVVIHDRTVDRTTDGTGQVSAMPLAELQQLDAGQGERIPTLAETLDLIAGRCTLDIEVKAEDAAVAVLRQVARYPNLQWLISSFRWNALAYVRQRQPEAELWVLDDQLTDDAVQAARDLGASTLNIDYRNVTNEQVQAMKSLGIDVGVWTVNDPAEASRLRDMGVVAICSDDPAALSRVYT